MGNVFKLPLRARLPRCVLRGSPQILRRYSQTVGQHIFLRCRILRRKKNVFFGRQKSAGFLLRADYTDKIGACLRSGG